jgi:RNA polymerase sigma-70 factor (ECF subfamily)
MNADEQDPYHTHASILLRLKETDTLPRQVAWKDFYNFYAPIISGFARNLGASPQDIQDVIQDVVMGFYRASPDFHYDPAKGRFRGFLKVCTFRALRARFAHGQRFRTNKLEDLDPESPEVTGLWTQQWDEELLRKAMLQVRADYQGEEQRRTFQAFEMYVVQGKPAAEVAQELDMKVNSVHKAKERITRALREKVAQLDQEHG